MNLIIARLDGDKINDSRYRNYIERLVKDGIGGFVVFGGDYSEIKKFIFHIQKMVSNPLIIASDIERGVGQQIKGGTLIPSQMGIVAGFNLKQEKNELKTLYSIVIKEAFDVGINLALIPVLDVNTEPQNPIISTRAFSDDPEVVSKYGRFVIKFFESYGLLTCGKHFPGHGGTQKDSHLELPVLKDDIEIHLKPFKEAIKSKVSSIMVGHIVASDIYPASLSEKIIDDLLKQKLGFKGTVLTDAMNMKALRDYKNPHALALMAGADVILHPEQPYEVLEEIKLAYERGMITERRIKEALRKINNLRKKIKKILPTIVTYEKKSLVNRAFKKTVTIIKNEIDDLNRRQIIPYLTEGYSDEIKRAFQNYFGSVYDLKDYKPSKATPLIATFTNIKAAGKEYMLKKHEETTIRKIISNNDAVVVSFGNPYILRPFRKAKTVIAVYDSNELAVSAFIESFSEGFKIKGRLPVKIEWIDE
ncbi:beta-N-acetylhexosaminidase [Thermodesulfovibrio aggregans]|uniref:beta-N-acetylhexosaminidase n=1 Tax=Thermodesulfovibrio aggregans TaxID=86166 RepID=A0A0U9HVY2_9BACT|nr:glycoside hydrolase family 3 N-terminal domain-containing protein [Thermodesulfovibrio aggregans]GAQ94877.1 beta-N-acetylhexosaminidase [Thermodesulfovibrio aggregans]